MSSFLSEKQTTGRTAINTGFANKKNRNHCEKEHYCGNDKCKLYAIIDKKIDKTY